MAGTGRHETEILTFSLGGQRYALWASDVRELLRAVAVVPLPGAPRIVEGVINMRGLVVPVLDVRLRFGLPDKPIEASDHLIVASAGGRLVAIRVDRALELARVAIDDVTEGQFQPPLVAGVARLPDGLAVIHDLESFLQTSEAAALDHALAAAGASA